MLKGQRMSEKQKNILIKAQTGRGKEMPKKIKKEYSKEDLKYAEIIMGNEMNECSEEIWKVIMTYNFTPCQLYGILESIKLTIANDIYSTPPEDIHVCTDCKETTYKEGKSSLKKVKEVDSAMYS